MRSPEEMREIAEEAKREANKYKKPPLTETEHLQALSREEWRKKRPHGCCCFWEGENFSHCGLHKHLHKPSTPQPDPWNGAAGEAIVLDEESGQISKRPVGKGWRVY